MSLKRRGSREANLSEKVEHIERTWQRIIRVAVGQDIRQHREIAGVSQEDLAKVLGWTKDSVSKVERGVFDIRLTDYMLLMNHLRDTDPAHPSILLGNRFLPRGRAAAVA
jgi:DNA-binding XRE family transcriptional regulator